MADLMSNIKDLRGITGAGFLDCKKALEENDNDIDKSIDSLRKKGLAKANKKSSREAKEGAIGIYSNENLSIMIKINTETDFAAKNETFLNFMDEIGGHVLSTNNSSLSLEEFKNMTFNGFTINDLIKNIIAKIGENIILSSLISFSKDDTSFISSYIHNAYRKNIGKIAVLLKAQIKNIDDDAKVFSKNLCMHIAASKPIAYDINQLDANLVKKEKELQIETIKASGKPDNIVDKILEGKMKKFYSESTFLHQQYILDPDKTISQVIDEFSSNNFFKVQEYKLDVLES